MPSIDINYYEKVQLGRWSFHTPQKHVGAVWHRVDVNEAVLVMSDCSDLSFLVEVEYPNLVYFLAYIF